MSDISWSDLPEDLLILIARKLQFIDVILSFCPVCVSWRSASKTERLDGTCQLPLLLQAIVENNVINTYAFDSVHNKLYKSTRFPNKLKTLCLGWKGWVLVDDEDGTMCLQHVFKATRPISLPKMPMIHANVSKAALSSDPFINDSDYKLAIIYETIWFGRGQLVLWRPQDKSFTEMQVGDNVYDDVIFHGGLLYAVSQDTVTVFDIAGPDPVTTYQIDGKIHLYIFHVFHLDNYLVELGGDLMLLRKSTKSIIRCGEYDVQFNVFLFSEFSEWKEVKDLGNRSIFIGAKNQSFALDNASEIQGCLPNHIYFVDYWWPCKARVVMYNLTNAKLEYLDCSPSEKYRDFSRTLLWVQPAFD